MTLVRGEQAHGEQARGGRPDDKRAQSRQARVLRFKMGVRLGTQLLAYCAVFALVAVVFEAFVSDNVGNWVADRTSTWAEYSDAELGTVEGIDWDHAQMLPVLIDDDGTVARWSVRDLSVYDAVKQLKIPVAACLFFMGAAVIMFANLNRSLRYFDELSGAVTEVMRNREEPVRLSDDLSIVQGELNAVREASLSDERAAVAAERRKNELVAYLAHDIKTPLTSVMGYLALLDEAPDLPEDVRRRYTRIAVDKAERLEGLIDEFFEITRYNLQAIPIERADVDVRLFCEQVADAFYPDAQARGVKIAVEAPEDQQFFVDPDKLSRAVGNMVRNAVAYADAGTTIDVRARRSEVTGAWLLEVENTGREISEAHLQSIFDKFYREEGARTTRAGGAGLGLAIAKEIVIAHGGGIRAESREGKTRFTIALL
ncbi:MAG: HAMP domain-containing sensor histidine kinase [Eggerthellaceae bacterium]|nr:HAMP domain-containing sensor histidine kinase [Eggerthellaceae bacterium]